MRLVELDDDDVLVVRLEGDLADPDHARRLAEAARLLRPQGRVAILAPGVQLENGGPAPCCALHEHLRPPTPPEPAHGPPGRAGAPIRPSWAIPDDDPGPEGLIR